MSVDLYLHETFTFYYMINISEKIIKINWPYLQLEIKLIVRRIEKNIVCRQYETHAEEIVSIVTRRKGKDYQKFLINSYITMHSEI